MTTKLTAGEFVQTTNADLKKLIEHDFIACRQSQFFKDLKAKLGSGEFLVIGDFAQNYTFVCQDAAQSFHWNNAQATIHPFVAYYRVNLLDTDGNIQYDENGKVVTELKNTIFCIISESNEHDTFAVYLYQVNSNPYKKLEKNIVISDIIPCNVNRYYLRI